KLTPRARALSLAVPGRLREPGLLRMSRLERTGLGVHTHHHGAHDLVRPGLPLLVPQRRQVADAAGQPVESMAKIAQERVAETDRLTGLLADGLDLDHLLTDRLAFGPPAVCRVPDLETGETEHGEHHEHQDEDHAGSDTAATSGAEEQAAQHTDDERHEGVDDDGHPDIDEVPQHPRAPRGQLTRRVMTGRVSPREGSVLRNRLAGLLRRREPGLLRKSARRLAEGLRPGRRIGTRHECSPSTRTSETIDDPGGQPAPVGTGANQPGGLRWRPPTPRCESEHHHWPYPGGGGNPGCCGWPGCGCGYPACCCGYPGWPYPAWGAPGWSSARTTTVCMILSAQV